MKNIEIVGTLKLIDSQFKIEVQVVDKDWDTYNTVINTHTRKYTDETQAKATLRNIATDYANKGYEIYNIKGFGY